MQANNHISGNLYIFRIDKEIRNRNTASQEENIKHFNFLKGGCKMETNVESKEEEIKGTETQGTNENSNVGHEIESIAIISEAKKVSDELKKNLEERKEALRALGGGSLAGIKTQPKEESPQEYAERVMGTKAPKL